MSTRYLEDFAAGEVMATTPVTVSQQDILEFGARYDPQPLHTDPQAAARSEYGGLIASGFQTIALAFSQFVRLGYLQESSLGGPALDEVRWPAPVRVDDELHTTVEVLEARPSRSKSDRGVLRLRFNTRRQDGVVVTSFNSVSIIRRRLVAAAERGSAGR